MYLATLDNLVISKQPQNYNQTQTIKKSSINNKFKYILKVVQYINIAYLPCKKNYCIK